MSKKTIAEDTRALLRRIQEIHTVYRLTYGTVPLYLYMGEMEYRLMHDHAAPLCKTAIAESPALTKEGVRMVYNGMKVRVVWNARGVLVSESAPSVMEVKS